MIAEMRGQADAMRRAEIEKIAEGLSAEELERLDKVTRSVMNKLLHGPTMAMKEYADKPKRALMVLQRCLNSICPMKNNGQRSA